MTAVCDRPPPQGGPPPGGPDPSRLRLILAAVLAGAVIVLPLVLLTGHGSGGPDAPPIATSPPPPPKPSAALVDPLAAGRLLASRPATGNGVLDSTIGDVASHFDNSGGDGLVNGAARPSFVDGKAITFAIPGGGERSEVLPLLPEYHEGDDLWVHDVSTLHGLPTDTQTWQLVLQWHQRGGTGSPPVALEAGKGRLRLANVGTDEQDVGALGPNDTIDVVVHVHFSRDPAKSVVDVWRDGLPKVVNYHPPRGTMIDAGDYLKVGLYRDPSITQDSSMTTKRLVVGPTDASINATGITPR
ncbi:polysaccharide lyase [Actinomycetospora endophytica]|uniref:Polysaccharide lyase n=1 Tax=Actinomycetospora endophytica TaxID=2291215 RepID=A0ABS8PHF6_9PSEU|nr:heparin lyase I family protein [Actinomycetospora endophytica]MCD2197362.1 polysaccharide lyase [Actinomycetospora endophytica]